MDKWLSTIVIKTPEKPIAYGSINRLYEHSHSMVYAYSPFAQDGLTIDEFHGPSLHNFSVFFPEAALVEYENVPGKENAIDLSLPTIPTTDWVCITETEDGRAPSERAWQACLAMELQNDTCYLVDDAVVLHASLLRDPLEPGEDLAKRAKARIKV